MAKRAHPRQLVTGQPSLSTFDPEVPPRPQEVVEPAPTAPARPTSEDPAIERSEEGLAARQFAWSRERRRFEARRDSAEAAPPPDSPADSTP